MRPTLPTRLKVRWRDPRPPDHNLHGPASMDALSKARSVAHVITQPRGVSDGDKANSPRSACYVIRSRWPPIILFISSGHPLASAAFELMDPALQGGGADS